MVDKDQTCVAVTIYNLAQGKGVTIGDSVAIPEPILTRHSFKHSDHVSKQKVSHFRLIKIMKKNEENYF